MEYPIPAATSYRDSKGLLVTFQYCIIAEKIASETLAFCRWYSENAKKYTAKFTVEKQGDYPEIPASKWALILMVSQEQGIHTAWLERQNAYDEPYGPLVEVTISPSASSEPAVWISWEIHPNRVVINKNYYCSALAPDSKPAQTLLPGYLYVKLSYRLSRPAIERRLLPRPDSFSDCTLVSNDGRRFPVQRVMMAHQSPVFLAMFQGSRAPLNGEVYFVDVSGDILEAMVTYVYTREIAEGKQRKELQELWRVAGKYNLVDMKQACVDRLFDGLKDRDLWGSYKFGRDNGLHELKEKAEIVYFESKVKPVPPKKRCFIPLDIAVNIVLVDPETLEVFKVD